MTDAARPLEAQITELRQSVAALEAQRAVLGDAVVGPALAAMQAQLASLHGQAGEQRKLVTIVFADLVGFTALSENLDPEDVRDIQQDYFGRWRAAIEVHGGVVEKFIGDAVMALFGVPAAQEDDAERAVRAALALHAGLAALNDARGTRLQMRVGVHTGPVVVAGAGSDFVATGDAVNLTARLQANAPPGGTLISHEAYSQVHGLFDVIEQPPLAVKGKAEPVSTYLVERARPGGFRAVARGVEGVDTRMIGREAELLMLQKAFRDMADERAAHLALVVGEPGLGKSRLADEFSLWLVDQDKPLHVLRGRAAPQSAGTPAGVLHDLFGQAFDIYDRDSVDSMRAKFRRGAAAVLAPDDADVMGQFCGYDFSASLAVRRLLGKDALAQKGREYLAQYISGLGRERPVLLLMDDLHWADDSSLDALLSLVTPDALPTPLLILALTRPALFERRPHWSEGLGNVTRLDLKPLSRREARMLAGEILQKVAHLPDALRDLIVSGSEGNPFFAEELVKMLMDDGVIAADAERWRVDSERLDSVRMPPTLAGVLQTRLDSLPRPEREALQRAAVVGRVFWDAAVARLGETDQAVQGPVLSALRSRDLIYRHEQSAFAHADEYAFKHGLLRDVTYETVLKRLRRGYHLRAAEWLEQQAGERTGEHAGRIAHHYQQAEAGPQALKYLTLAADAALARYANPEAAEYYRQALDLLAASLDTRWAATPEPADLEAQRASCLDGLGRAEYRQDNFPEAMAAWREAADLYLRHAAGENHAARLYARMARAITRFESDAPASYDTARSGLERLANAPDSAGLAALRLEVGRGALLSGDSDMAQRQVEAALKMAESVKALDVQADAMGVLALITQLDLKQRLEAAQRGADLADQAGGLTIAQSAQGNLGAQIWQRGEPGDIDSAVQAGRRAVHLAMQRGSPFNVAFDSIFLIQVTTLSGDLRGAREALEAAQRVARVRPDMETMQIRINVCQSVVLRFAGQLEPALEHAWRAIQYADAHDDPRGLIDGLWQCGNMLIELGRLEEAEAALARVIAPDTARDMTPLAAEARASLALARARQGRAGEAAALMDEAQALAGPDASNDRRYCLALARGQTAALHGDWSAAFDDLRQALNISQRAGWGWRTAEATRKLGEAHLARGRPDDHTQASALLEAALADFERMGADGWTTRVREALDGLAARG